MLLAHEIKLARLRELELNEPFLQVLLLLAVAHLEDTQLREVTLMKFHGHFIQTLLKVTLTLGNLYQSGRVNLISLLLSDWDELILRQNRVEHFKLLFVVR